MSGYLRNWCDFSTFLGVMANYGIWRWWLPIQKKKHFMCMRKGIPQLPIIAGAQVQGKRDRSRHPCRKPMDFPMKIMGMFNEFSFSNHPSGIIFYRIWSLGVSESGGYLGMPICIRKISGKGCSETKSWLAGHRIKQPNIYKSNCTNGDRWNSRAKAAQNKVRPEL